MNALKNKHHPMRKAISIRSAIPPEDTKERLILAAKNLFAEKGFDGTTVKEIAERTNMNVSLISYHFNGKEGLYRTCIEQLGKAHLNTSERILQNPTSLEDFRVRLKLFIEEFIITHIDEPELCRIVTRECDLQLEISRDIFQNTFLKAYENLVIFFKHAQAQGLLRKDLNIEIITRTFFGGLLHIAQKDKINETYFGETIRDKKYRESVVEQTLSFCLQGCVAIPHAPQKRGLK